MRACVGTAARIGSCTGVVYDAGRLYFTDSYGRRIRVVNLATMQVTTLSGSGVIGIVDGNAAAAQFNYPGPITIGGGFLYVCQVGPCVDARIVDWSKIARLHA